ncbi:hypothetical protein [Qipengyuania flava]|uniref:hypothetical protein n=1 Tax=Qipengyuania flava TaxID=192812 RepID=UPI001C627B9F|nr:hypothetical protein [Qipengyuania flava]QYJ06105.1 hypothetical protein KUV82_08365 [Qipengyuania flava]
MADDLVHELPEATRLALASAGGNRTQWLTFFALDARVGGYVLGAQEPLLAQMRIAWWRDELAKAPSMRPQGDQLLDAIGSETEGLRELLDGWEALLAEAPLGREGLEPFVSGRATAVQGLARRLSVKHLEGAGTAARLWALADLAFRLPDESDRQLALDMAEGLTMRSPALPKPLRPLAVLAGLSRRALARGGAPLVGDRSSPFVALRLGLFGR